MDMRSDSTICIRLASSSNRLRAVKSSCFRAMNQPPVLAASEMARTIHASEWAKMLNAPRGGGLVFPLAGAVGVECAAASKFMAGSSE